MKRTILFMALLCLSFSLTAQVNSVAASLSVKKTSTGLFSEPETITKPNNDPWEKGFFLDALSSWGVRSTIRPAVPGTPSQVINTENLGSAGFRFGNKWYFGDGATFIPGIQVVWMRFGAIYPLLTSNVITNGNASNLASTDVSMALFNVGSTNLIKFNDNIGLEVNFNIGFNANASFQTTYSNTTTNQTLLQFGLLVNPVVKFRYKKFAVGIDIAYGHSFAPSMIYESAKNPVAYINETGTFLVGLTIGGKF